MVVCALERSFWIYRQYPYKCTQQNGSQLYQAEVMNELVGIIQGNIVNNVLCLHLVFIVFICGAEKTFLHSTPVNH